MHARVTISQTSPDKVDDAIRVVEENVIPAAKQMKGYKGGYWLGDRSTGRGITITLWDSEEDLQASEEATQQVRSQAAQQIGLEIQSIERLEVVAEG